MAKDGRMHIRVAKPLADDIHAYAQRRHTSLTQLITDYFVKLLQEEETKVSEAEQV